MCEESVDELLTNTPIVIRPLFNGPILQGTLRTMDDVTACRHFDVCAPGVNDLSFVPVEDAVLTFISSSPCPYLCIGVWRCCHRLLCKWGVRHMPWVYIHTRDHLTHIIQVCSIKVAVLNCQELIFAPTT